MERSNVLVCAAVAVAGVAGLTRPAKATFHTWRVSEMFSDSTGNVQFIQFHEAFGSNDEQFVGGRSIVATSTFTFPANLPLPSDTTGKYFLVATSAYAALPGAVTPDYTIPSHFLSLTGGTLNYASGIDTFTYGALPTDGQTSFERVGVSGGTFTPIFPNSETNFAGQTGSVHVVPEPGFCLLAPLGVLALRRRRSVTA